MLTINIDPLYLAVSAVVVIIAGSIWADRRERRRHYRRLLLDAYWKAQGCSCSLPDMWGHLRECQFYEPTEEDRLLARAHQEIVDGWTPTDKGTTRDARPAARLSRPEQELVHMKYPIKVWRSLLRPDTLVLHQPSESSPAHLEGYVYIHIDDAAELVQGLSLLLDNKDPHLPATPAAVVTTGPEGE